ncbi:MAG: 5-(carboxyamino)imidazole ribonucleotide synthase [Bacteroidota bacterium]
MSFPKLGILGGGQLGKMLCQAASCWELPIYALDTSIDFPAGPYAKGFQEGSFKNYADVLGFGRQMDVVTIEIEHVNTDALKQLQKEEKIVHPDPAALEIIKDKGKQKLFYREHNIPTSPFNLYNNKEAVLNAVKSGTLSLPFVQKTRTAGYDGKGVAVIQSESDLTEKLLDGACMIEDMVDMDKEIAVVVAQNERGEISAFDPVEMEFNPIANLVEFLICPSTITAEQAQTCTKLAKKVIKAFNICGLLAVELFLDKDGNILVNEVAPRPHNSGHHTIDAAVTSQYEQHLRGVLNLPLGSTQLKSPSVMVNLLGADGYTGKAVYEGLAECLAIEGVKIHLYGKEMTKPFRKMGHATIIADSIEAAKEKARQVQQTLIIKT